MSDIFREVDEEVRQDRSVALWNKYKGLIFTGAVLIVVATGVYRFFEQRRLAAAEASGGRYQQAIEASRTGKSTDATALLSGLAADAKAGGYSKLAAMRLAAEQGASDPTSAIKSYDALAEDKQFDPLMRDAARLRAAILVADTADRAEAERRLTPLAASGAPFRSAARELLALVALKADDFETAGNWLDQIVIDADTPQAMRERADAFLAIVRSNRKPDTK